MTGRGEMMEQARGLADAISEALPPDVGFGLFLFSYGEGGFLSWISSCERADVAKSLKKLLERWEAGDDDHQS